MKADKIVLLITSSLGGALRIGGAAQAQDSNAASADPRSAVAAFGVVEAVAGQN